MSEALAECSLEEVLVVVYDTFWTEPKAKETDGPRLMTMPEVMADVYEAAGRRQFVCFVDDCSVAGDARLRCRRAAGAGEPCVLRLVLRRCGRRRSVSHGGV